jgi:transcriptional regulator with XRE-family HTH domain/tetratricopeptide (TPR) repeat protein
VESFDEAERQVARKLGSELRRLREQKDLTQGALGRKAGHYSRSTIATIEIGGGKCSLKLIRGCDDALEAGGTLVKLYFELKETRARWKTAPPSKAAQLQGSRLEGHPRPARHLPPLSEAMEHVLDRAERVVRYGNPGEAVLEEYERLVELRALGYATEPPGPFLDDVLLEVDDVAGLLEACRSPVAQRRLLRVLGRLAALVSVVANDLGRLRAAGDWMRTARLAAVETDDRNLQAWTLAREGFHYLHYRRPVSRALQLAEAAESVGAASSGSAAVMAPTVRARALAQLGVEHAALEALRQADEAFERVDAPRVGVFGWSLPQLRLSAGKTLTNLGATRRALEAHEEALSLFSPNEILDPALVRLDRAQTLIRAGDLTGGCRLSEEVLRGLPPGYQSPLVGSWADDALRAIPPEQRVATDVEAFREARREVIETEQSDARLN